MALHRAVQIEKGDSGYLRILPSTEGHAWDIPSVLLDALESRVKRPYRSSLASSPVPASGRVRALLTSQRRPPLAGGPPRRVAHGGEDRAARGDQRPAAGRIEWGRSATTRRNTLSRREPVATPAKGYHSRGRSTRTSSGESKVVTRVFSPMPRPEKAPVRSPRRAWPPRVGRTPRRYPGSPGGSTATAASESAHTTTRPRGADSNASPGRST